VNVFVISTMSSSSSSSEGVGFDLRGGPDSVGFSICHCPVGSTTTASTFDGVDFRMSLTY
jgi:hypothetical protein